MSSAIAQKTIKLKRAYQRPARGDGVRVLVDRLWPRGVRKADAAIDHWMKDVTPSTTLRHWFGHEPARWEGFRRRYRQELKKHQKEVSELRGLARHGAITLVYAARDQAHNEAVVLRDYLLGR
jgi:uncharacterized protein YeaO (DUF488 family)